MTMSHNWFIHCNKRTVLMEDVDKKGNWLKGIWNSLGYPLNFSVSLRVFLKIFLEVSI